ncbi:HEAT repeat protein [Peptoanaerobacter stomatis]|jgi:HEAT repeat-containing protein|uniref:HEAT repeat protein n=1 Tax=Peptoanaerobacter stomatis TaxID=796937 RepID=J5UJF4_9FIRM|nr:HEAT repeat domain-containing protein [Peptoanaerobacter stomatis]EJU23004.1 HEAT repeat protein [Peptoanaerobacter stomatis]NWO25660.1 HEAT repeat domain-containing protein [Peptostreptococcaceae bacterium oral taxon 081]
MANKDEDKETLKELREITKTKENWGEVIDDVANKLNENHSVIVKAKILWLLGEMGLNYSKQVEAYIIDIAFCLEDEHPKIRERAVNALGRIGRADKNLIIPYLDKIMKMRKDQADDVRLAFVWACENIATNAPELFCERMDLFYKMIQDKCVRVRIEAPEMFRVMGKRKPQYVKPYLEKLQWFADNDTNPVVRIHSAGAIRITKRTLKESEDNATDD